MMTYHLNSLLEHLPKEKVTFEMDEDFKRIVTKYTQFQQANKQYINMFDVLYDYHSMSEFKGLCFKLHGIKEEDVQIIIQDFINDGLINPLTDMDIVPSLSRLGYSIYYRVKSMYKESFSNEYIKLNLNSNILKIEFVNCQQVIAFLKKYPIPNILDAFRLEPNEVTLELKYQSKDKALEVFNQFKDSIELFGNES